jgi:polyisoprenoid-binding protein YceI
MKNLFTIVAIGISVASASLKTNAPEKWVVDKNHARVSFVITHNMASDVEGSFKIFDATITTTSDDFSGSTIDFTADAASITTDNERRDKDIRSDDFLDVEKFPKLIFKSTSVIKTGASTYKITGNLTLHGLTKPVVLEALVRTPPAATGVKDVAGFRVSGIVKRSDFNIGPKYADLLLGDEITLSANGEFAKAK